MKIFYSITLLLLFCKAVTANRIFQGIQKAGRGDGFLHKTLPEMYRYADTIYVRVYQAVYSEAHGFANVYKDIWQDENGNVILKPKVKLKDGIITYQEPFWISVGEARHPLDFVHKYKSQNSPSADPLVRSFLVKLEAIEDVMNPRYLTTEPFSTKFKMDKNVDLYMPNSFGFEAESLEKIRANTLPNSLVTYVWDFDAEMKYPPHWGTVLSQNHLKERLGIPLVDVPALHDLDNSKTRSQYYQVLEADLLSLNERDFNDKYGVNLEGQLSRMKAEWAEEVRKRREFNDAYYPPNQQSPEPTIYAIDMNKIPNIDEDDTFKTSRHAAQDMPRLSQSIERNKVMLIKRSKMMTSCEALSKLITNILSNRQVDKSVKKKVNKFQRADVIMKTVIGDDSKVNGIKIGDFSDLVHLESRFQSFIDNLKNDVSNGDFSSRIDKLMDSLEHPEKRIYIAFSDSDVTLLKQQFGDSIEVHHVDSDRLYTGKTEHLIVPDHDSKVVVIYNDENLKKLPEILSRNIAGDKLQEVHFIQGTSGELKVNDYKISGFIDFMDDARGKKMTIENVIIPTKKGPLKYDAITNRMYQGSTDLGTPRAFRDGYLVHHEKIVTRNILDKASVPSSAVAVEKLQQEKFTGMVFFKGSDPITDSEYRQFSNTQLQGNPVVNIRKYDYEMIIQIGDSEPVRTASSSLYDRYGKEGKTVLHVKYSDDFLEFINGANVPISKKTRINIVGHGLVSTDGGSLTIESYDAATLGRKLVSTLNSDGVTLSPGKISLIACNEDEAGNALDRSIKFGQEFTNVLQDGGVASDVSLRTGYVQVDEMGHKQYGVMSGSDIEWSYRDSPPVLVRFNNGVEYGIVHNDMIDWTSIKPESIEKGKVLVVSQQTGDFTEANKVSKLLAIQPLNDGSGSLNIASYRNLLDSDDDVYINNDEVTYKKYTYDEGGLRSSQEYIDVTNSANQLLDATDEALGNTPDKNWIPLIDSAEEINGKTTVTLLNTETYERMTVDMKSDAFVRFKKTAKKYAIQTSSLPGITRTSVSTVGLGSAMGVGSFIYAAIQMQRLQACRRNSSCAMSETGGKLAKALEIQAYYELADGALNTAFVPLDIAEMVVSAKIGKSAVNGITTVSKTGMKFLKFTNVVGKIGMGVGVVGSAVGLGFSGYQLAHAQTKAEKIQYGLQVGLDSLSTVIGGVALGAAIAAAATGSAVAASIASVAGPAGFAVAIVGILVSTITALVFEFKNTRAQARIVGKYFYDLDQVYMKHGYDFNVTSQTLSFLPHAIIKNIDTEERTVQYDSQFIYRTRHGRTGSGKRNYFFWYKDFPKMIRNKNEAINIRNGIGYPEYNRFWYNVSQIVMPVVPKSYISYEYSRLPGCTIMHDKGFDVIRRLENDYRFDYDFYIVPGEQIVSSISHEYVPTTVTTKLTDNIKLILIPKAPVIMQGYNTYVFQTSARTHHVILNDGISVILHSTGNMACSWSLDITEATNQLITFPSNNHISFGNISVEVVNRNDQIFVFKRNMQVRVNPFEKKITVDHITMSTSFSAQDIKEYIRKMSINLLKDQKFIVINNFTVGSQLMGNAFYEIQNEKFLYSDLTGVDVSVSFKENILLLAKLGNQVYFMSQEHEKYVLWWTDADSHQIGATYNLYCGNEGFRITRLNVQEGHLLLIQQVFNVSLIYMLQPNEMTLVTIDGTQADISRLAEACFPALKPVALYLLDERGRFPGQCIYARSAAVLPVKQTTPDHITRHFWLYMTDQHPTDHYTGMFCKASDPPVATGIIVPNITNECEDLTLRDIKLLPTKEEAYFFFCEKNKTIFYQVNDSLAVELQLPGGVDKMEDSGPAKYIKSKNGGHYVLSETGEFSLAALPFGNISNISDWEEWLVGISNETLLEGFIIISDMMNLDNKSLSAWYDVESQRFVVVSPALNITDIVYLGPTPNHYLVWLYDQQAKAVILQQVIDKADMSQFIISHHNRIVWNSVKPAAKILISNVTSAEYVKDGVFCVSREGLLLHIDHYSRIKLLGVNRTWIKENSGLEKLSNLCHAYKESGLITMGHEVEDGSWKHIWYHCEWKAIISIFSKPDIEPVFLGQDMNSKTVYFTVEGNLTEYKLPSAVRLRRAVDLTPGNTDSAEVKIAAVVGKTLLMEPGVSGNHTDIPVIDGTVSLVISLSDGCYVHIPRDAWMHYRTILITNTDKTPVRCSFFVDAPYPCNYPAQILRNDTIFTDPLSDRQLILEDMSMTSDNVDYVAKIILCNSDPIYLKHGNNKGTLLVWYLTIAGLSVLFVLFCCIACTCNWKRNRPKKI